MSDQETQALNRLLVEPDAYLTDAQRRAIIGYSVISKGVEERFPGLIDYAKAPRGRAGDAMRMRVLQQPHVKTQAESLSRLLQPKAGVQLPYTITEDLSRIADVLAFVHAGKASDAWIGVLMEASMIVPPKGSVRAGDNLKLVRFIALSNAYHRIADPSYSRSLGLTRQEREAELGRLMVALRDAAHKLGNDTSIQVEINLRNRNFGGPGRAYADHYTEAKGSTGYTSDDAWKAATAYDAARKLLSADGRPSRAFGSLVRSEPESLDAKLSGKQESVKAKAAVKGLGAPPSRSTSVADSANDRANAIYRMFVIQYGPIIDTPAAWKAKRTGGSQEANQVLKEYAAYVSKMVPTASEIAKKKSAGVVDRSAENLGARQVLKDAIEFGGPLEFTPEQRRQINSNDALLPRRRQERNEAGKALEDALKP